MSWHNGEAAEPRDSDDAADDFSLEQEIAEESQAMYRYLSLQALASGRTLAGDASHFHDAARATVIRRRREQAERAKQARIESAKKRPKRVCTYESYRSPAEQCRDASYGEWLLKEVGGTVVAWVLAVLAIFFFLAFMGYTFGPR